MGRGLGVTSHRQERVADVIRTVLARALHEEVRDPRIGFVTLTAVRLSADLRHARVFVSTLEPGARREEALSALRRAEPFLRRALAREARLRHVPRLDFRFDDSVERGSRVERLLAELREADPEPPGKEPA
jgi:ribosome-binding factor A